MKVRDLVTTIILGLEPILEGALFAIAMHYSGVSPGVITVAAVILMVLLGMGKAYYINYALGSMARWKYLMAIFASAMTAVAVTMQLKHPPKEALVVAIITIALCYLMAVMGKWCATDPEQKGCDK